MKIQILETEEMHLCRPHGVKELFCAENVLVVDPKTGYPLTSGNQVLLEGSGKDFNKWLQPFGTIYFNFGSMMLEQFTGIDLTKNPLKNT